MSAETKPAEPASATPARKVLLTCAQPTGNLHLGNYLGAVQNWRRMQDDYECYFGVVDMHAITVPIEPAKLRAATLDLVAWYLACGLDPAKASVFVQSHVIGHAELAWVLGCLCPLGQLERMTQFKDKSAKHESIGAGLLTYPVLMAADILLYNADAVPVGEDQKQHLELARDLAEKFNRTYSPTFNVPAPFISKTGARIMSLADPEKKMSKSDENPSGTLYLNDPVDVLRKKIMSAVTDSGSEVLARDDKPGVANLLSILSAVTGRAIPELEAQFAGQGYGAFKSAVADAVIGALEPAQKKYAELMANKDHLLAVMKAGGDAAQKTAYKTLAKVYRKVGFLERGR
ncbi:MAG TPA: tryptophan--tRNA ligase [Opitutales bacterium]|nr:tryptophan--tRNA ligase [Opitutales bacterium]